MNVLFIRGIPDDSMVKMLTFQKKTIFDVGGSCNVYAYIDNFNFEKHLYTMDAQPSKNMRIQNIDLIFNQIADADTHKITLLKLNELIEKFELPIINNPKFVLETTRDKIYQKLKDIRSVVVPKTIRINSKTPQDIVSQIKNNGLSYPLLLRECGSHGGLTTYLLNSDKEIKELYSIPLDGREYYITQYYDYRDDNDYYTKIRLAIVDGKIFIRHCIFSNEWMVHGQNRIKSLEINEENFLQNFEKQIKPKIEKSIQKIYSKINLDYFGIDCHIDKNMNILIFEINANMNMLIRTPRYTDLYIDKIKDAISNMIDKRLSKILL